MICVLERHLYCVQEFSRITTSILYITQRKQEEKPKDDDDKEKEEKDAAAAGWWEFQLQVKFSEIRCELLGRLWKAWFEMFEFRLIHDESPNM